MPTPCASNLHLSPPPGVIDRAICGVEEMLTLLAQPKTAAGDKDKQSKGVFLTTISFMPDGEGGVRGRGGGG